MKSDSYKMLNNDLQKRVDNVKNEIAIAAFIENVNLKYRYKKSQDFIEFLLNI